MTQGARFSAEATASRHGHGSHDRVGIPEANARSLRNWPDMNIYVYSLTPVIIDRQTTDTSPSNGADDNASRSFSSRMIHW